MKLRLIVATLLLLPVACPSSVSAQVPTVPTALAEAEKTGNKAAVLGELTTLLNSGDWKKLQKKAIEAIEKVPALQNARKPWIVLSWAGTDPAGEEALLWTLVHSPYPEAYTSVLPGLKGSKGLYEVYLSSQPGAGFTSYYTSTRVEDPLLAQIPSVVEKIAEPMFLLFGGVAGVLPPRVQPPPSKKEEFLYAWVRHVPLPMARSDVKAHYFAAEPIPIDDFKKAAGDLSTKLRFGAISHSVCARDFAATLSEAAKAVAETSCKAPEAGEIAAQRRTKSEACLKAFDERFLTEYKKHTTICPTETAALKVVNREFRDLVANWRPQKMKVETTFENRPLTHFGFGALSSFVFDGRTKEPRAKVDDGMLVEDPLPRLLTAIVLNYNPFGYNASSARIGWRERLNLFGGATVTPNFGLTSGINFILVRGLGVNAGYAHLFYMTKQDDDTFGQAPSDPNDPMRLGDVGVWFAGLSYNFK